MMLHENLQPVAMSCDRSPIAMDNQHSLLGAHPYLTEELQDPDPSKGISNGQMSRHRAYLTGLDDQVALLHAWRHIGRGQER